MHHVVMQFEATIEKQNDELDELSERLRLQEETHQQSLATLQNEHQITLEEVL